MKQKHAKLYDNIGWVFSFFAVFISVKLFYNKNKQKNSMFCTWPLYHKKELRKLEKSIMVEDIRELLEK